MEQAQFEAMVARLERESRASPPGLVLLEQAIAADADATGAACERAHAYPQERHDARAQAWVDRWTARQAWEQERLRQMRQLDPAHELREHALEAGELLQAQRCLASVGGKVAQAWLAECEWPVPVILCAVRADDRDLLPRLQALGGSEIARA